MSQVTSIREQWSEGKTISEIARTQLKYGIIISTKAYNMIVE